MGKLRRENEGALLARRRLTQQQAHIAAAKTKRTENIGAELELMAASTRRIAGANGGCTSCNDCPMGDAGG